MYKQWCKLDVFSFTDSKLLTYSHSLRTHSFTNSPLLHCPCRRQLQRNELRIAQAAAQRQTEWALSPPAWQEWGGKQWQWIWQFCSCLRYREICVTMWIALWRKHSSFGWHPTHQQKQHTTTHTSIKARSIACWQDFLFVAFCGLFAVCMWLCVCAVV